MKVTIKYNNESTLALTVPDNATVEDLKIAAVVSIPPSSGLCIKSPNSINLWYSGHKLHYSELLSSYKICPQSLEANPNLTVHLTLANDLDSECNQTVDTDPIIQNESAIADDEDLTEISAIKKTRSKSRTKSRTKSKSKKCTFQNCTSAPLRMVGDCQFCQGKFCSKHRLLESHNCSGLKICKDKSYERNALKLQSEQTVASKV
jgi:hypothetical protein